MFLKVSPRRGISRFGRGRKLSARYIGSFDILERIGNVAYWLALPPQLSGIHDVFHVSMLQKYEPNPSYILERDNLELDVDVTFKERLVQILDHREKVLRRKTI